MDYSTYTQTKSAYDGEGQLTSAISYVTSDNQPKVYVITGHGESSLDSSFQSALEKMNISVEELTLLQQDAVPDDAEQPYQRSDSGFFLQMMQQKQHLSGWRR